MRGAAALVLLGLLLHGVPAEEEKEEEDDEDFVVQLNAGNFEQKLNKINRILVNFHMPGEAACDAIKKDYSKASKMILAEQLDSRVAKVDVSVDKELAEQHNVTTYPALKYFVNGKFDKDYDGKKDTDGITLWLKNKEDPPVKEIKEEDLQEFLDGIENDEFAFVAHVKKKSTRAKAFFRACEDTLREWDVAKISFGVVWLPKTADPKADAKLFMHRPGILSPDPLRVDYQDTSNTTVWSEDKLTWWAKNATYASLGKKFTRNNYAPQSMDHMGWSAAIVGMTDDNTAVEGQDERDEPLRPKLMEALKPFAIEYPQWKFVMAEIEKLEDHEMELLTVKYGEEPRIIVLGVDKKKYHLVGEEKILDHETISKFLADAKDKRIKPHRKTAAAPEDEYDDDGVFVLTGSSFDEIVLDEEKDVFVEFYAPWCKHCQKLAPEWAKFAKKADKEGWKDRGVIVAKFDVGANECDEEIPSFPKMVLYPAVKAEKKFAKKKIYNGKRDAGALFEFVSEMAQNLQDEEQEEEAPDPKKKRKKVQSIVDRELEKKKKAAEEL